MRLHSIAKQMRGHCEGCNSRDKILAHRHNPAQMTLFHYLFDFAIHADRQHTTTRPIAPVPLLRIFTAER